MSYNLNSVNGGYRGLYRVLFGVIKGDTRSLGYSSYARLGSSTGLLPCSGVVMVRMLLLLESDGDSFWDWLLGHLVVGITSKYE